MQITVGERWQSMIHGAVESGRYVSPEDVVAEALRLLATRETQFAELKASIIEALANPVPVTEEEIEAAMAASDARLRAEGYE